MKEMDDTVEISGEGAAKAANELNNTEDQPVNTEASTDEEAVSESESGDIEIIRSELTETKNRLLRQAAEFQNYKRRTEQEKSLYVRTGKSR